MKLSILICVHSKDELHDKLLIQALLSMNKQTYNDFDVFIILDECWNNTENKINEYKYNFKFKIFKKDKKEGLAIAKNFGLKYIDADFVGYLDADDQYLPKKLEKQINFLNENKVDFLGTLCWNNINGSIVPSCFKEGQYVTNDDIKNIINKENVLTHGTMLIKRKCLDELNGYNNIKGKEDWDLWKRAINNNYIFHQLQERLYILTLGTSVAR
jgi:glycosyltransferase involved in cell wall biosynthesis